MKTRYFGRISAVLILSLLFMTVSALPGIKTETQSLAVSKYYKVQIKVGKKSFEAKLKKNKTTEQLVARMPFAVKMNELNGNEKYHYFDDSFVTNAKTVNSIKTGDIKLYGDNCLVIFYKSFESGYEYTDLGKITKTRGLVKALGKGNVKVKFRLKGQSAGNVTASSTPEQTPEITTVPEVTSTPNVTSGPEPSITPNSETKNPVQTVTPTASQLPSGEAKLMKMKIDGVEVSVKWEENESVNELRKLAEDGEITISMSMYGGFEQVGSLETSLTRNDVQMTTEPGDIVLYSGNQIVVFYGSNSWSYTKLGKIQGLTDAELKSKLAKGDVTIKLYC